MQLGGGVRRIRNQSCAGRLCLFSYALFSPPSDLFIACVSMAEREVEELVSLRV